MLFKQGKTILFVCCVNRDRSVIAEKRLNQQIKGEFPALQGKVKVTSAGIVPSAYIDHAQRNSIPFLPPYFGKNPNPSTVAYLAGKGIDVASYVSREINKELATRTDLVLTMDFLIRDEVIHRRVKRFLPGTKQATSEVEMLITNLTKVAKSGLQMQDAVGVYKQVPLGVANGAPNFVFRVFTLEPGGHTPYHEHAVEHMNYIIEGEGALVDRDGKEQYLKAGDFALVLPGEKHQFRNKSADKSLVLI